MPDPSEVQKLIGGARSSRRPEHADVIYFAATTGARRGEICALRKSHLDVQSSSITIVRNIVKRKGKKIDKSTKNRRRRVIAIDHQCAEILTHRMQRAHEVAEEANVELIEDPYFFACDFVGLDPWDPDTITQYFGRLRDRLELQHLEFKGLRRFMDTYGQELGFSLAQVAMRAGHDPAVAAKHYTGRVQQADRDLAEAIGGLLSVDDEPKP